MRTTSKQSTKQYGHFARRTPLDGRPRRVRYSVYIRGIPAIHEGFHPPETLVLPVLGVQSSAGCFILYQGFCRMKHGPRAMRMSSGKPSGRVGPRPGEGRHPATRPTLLWLGPQFPGNEIHTFGTVLLIPWDFLCTSCCGSSHDGKVLFVCMFKAGSVSTTDLLRACETLPSILTGDRVPTG